MNDLAAGGRSDMIAAIMGDEFAANWNTDPAAFDAPMKAFCERVTFEEVWGRPGLDIRSRRLVTIAALVALRQTAALRSHIHAAVAADVTPEEVREALIHVSIYCGIPAALESFSVAGEVVAASMLED